MNRYGIPRPAVSGVRHASPDVLQSLGPRRSRKRAYKRLGRRLSSPAAAVIVVSLLAAAGAGISSRIEGQRVARAFLVPKAWPATTINLATPVTATLTTDLGGSFLHYAFTIKSGVTDPDELEKLLG